MAIIDCATVTQAISCFNKLTHHFERPFSYHHPVQYGMSSLFEIPENSGLIILGSLSDVHEKLAWQVELAEFLKEKISSGTPTLGICFGHQLVQDIFGGSVDLIDAIERPHQGTRQFTINQDHFNFKAGENFELFVTHNYEVKNLAPNFISLAQSKQCLFDAIAHKDLPFLSVQGHPEASKQFVSGHITKEISDEKFKKATLDGHRFIERFLEIIDKA